VLPSIRAMRHHPQMLNKYTTDVLRNLPPIFGGDALQQVACVVWNVNFESCSSLHGIPCSVGCGGSKGHRWRSSGAVVRIEKPACLAGQRETCRRRWHVPYVLLSVCPTDLRPDKAWNGGWGGVCPRSGEAQNESAGRSLSRALLQGVVGFQLAYS
jgi:hypothetical protein